MNKIKKMNYHVPKYDELKYDNTRDVVKEELSKIKHLTSDKLTNLKKSI